MEERPEGLADAEVAAALARHWDLVVSDLRYLPVGFGGYHWSADDADGGRWFVTASDLARYDSLAGLEQAPREVRFVFEGKKGETQLFDVYVDPRMK